MKHLITAASILFDVNLEKLYGDEKINRKTTKWDSDSVFRFEQWFSK